MRGVSLNATLENWDNFVWEFVESASTVGDRSGLKAIEFIQNVVDGSVSDEMINVVVFRCEALLFVDKGRGAGERVMDVSDDFGVREGFAS